MLVMGGSLGGLGAAVALRHVGCHVDVLERGAHHEEGRGAGIVVQPDLLALTRLTGGAPLAMTTCSSRRYLDASGKVTQEMPMAQEFTSWGAIYAALRQGVPDAHYHADCEVTGIDSHAAGVRVTTAQGRDVKADGLVIADGSRSRGRDWLDVPFQSDYAGYIAWRGVIEEADVDADLARFFEDRFTFGETKSGGHILCYLIPGAGRAVERGQRRLNWVWYQTIPVGPDLSALLTDKDGRAHTSSIAPGDLSAASRRYLQDRAKNELPAPFADLIDATQDPFIQAITDLAASTMTHGRACLLGDAAFVVRPHTAGATAKAAADAMTLASLLRDTPDDMPQVLADYDRLRLRAGQQMSGYGVQLGQRSVAT